MNPTLLAVTAAITEIATHFEHLRSDFIEIDDELPVVGFSFPESDGSDYDFDEVIHAAGELQYLKPDLGAGILVTPTRYYQLVASDSFKSHQFLESQPEDIQHGDCTISIRSCPLLVALAAFENQAYVRHSWAPDHYTAVEIASNDGRALDPQNGKTLVESFLFELATMGLIFARTDFVDETDMYPPDEDEKPPQMSGVVLEAFNDGMRLYNAAVQVTDPELELLSLYKVLEYFAPVSVNLEAAEAMRRRLDAGRREMHDGAFIQSIFELARSFETRRTDKEMMVSIFASSVDIVRLSALVPSSLRPNVTDLSKRTEIAAASRSLAEALVATRNQVAHAKANYSPTGKEVPMADLGHFNRFVRAAAESTIRWYNRLPAHQRSLTSTDAASGDSGD